MPFISLFKRLDETRIYGITTNLQYLQALLQGGQLFDPDTYTRSC